MAEEHHFRTAFNGFHKEDVVRYIEFLNKKNSTQVNQLKEEIQALKEELEGLREGASTLPEAAEDGEAQEQIAALTAQNQALEEKLAALTQELEQEKAKAADQGSRELEAYRRAERMERAAKQRSQQIYQQAAGILAEATAMVDASAQQFTDIADSIGAQFARLQTAAGESKSALKDAAALMYAIRPEEEAE